MHAVGEDFHLMPAQVFGQRRIDRAWPTRLGRLIDTEKSALHVAHHQPTQRLHLPVWGASLCQGKYFQASLPVCDQAGE